jgi:hypothetical protein
MASAGWGAPSRGVLLADAAKCLSSSRIASDSEEIDPSSNMLRQLIEDFFFLRYKVRLARGEMRRGDFRAAADTGI